MVALNESNYMQKAESASIQLLNERIKYKSLLKKKSRRDCEED